jgi:hypothetical protein
MTEAKPYIEHTFTGLTSFTETLDRILVSYRTMNIKDVDDLFETENQILTRGKDTLTFGECAGNGITLYFMDFGLLLTNTIISHMVFIFDHMPTAEELRLTTRDMEYLTLERLKQVQKESGNAMPLKDASDGFTLH